MALGGRDRAKILKAGFQVFRREESRLVIKICNERNEWTFFKKCSNKKQLKDEMDRLLDMQLCIEDK